MSTTTIKMPTAHMTVAEFANLAQEQGKTFVEFLEEHGPSLMPPAGFVMAMDAMAPDLPAGYYDGPSEAGDGWQIETTFTMERGVMLELLPPQGDYSMGGFTASQALAAGEALTRLATKYAVTERA